MNADRSLSASLNRRRSNAQGTTTMSNGFDSMQNFGKENMDLAMQSADAMGKAFQAITAEAADYSKRTLDAGTSAFEQLVAAKSLDKAFEIQSEFMRSAYEGYVGQVAKMNEIVTDMARSAYKPYESLFGKFGK
jgi:hypothetical protein